MNEPGLADVQSRATCLKAVDGAELAGHWYYAAQTGRAPEAVVVIVPGGGIPATSYERLARFLALRGAEVLCFDYRGIGESRRGSLKGLYAPIEVWGQLDVGVALATARSAFPGLPLEVVAHSIGSLLVGAAPDAASVSKIVFFAPHTAYWGDYGRRWRWLLYLTWHVFMPTVTKMVGYFPGRSLRLGEDLPKEFALDWAGRRNAALMATPEYRGRFGEILAGYERIRASTLAISVTDDAFAPPEAARRLLAIYPRLFPVHEVVAPADLGCRHLGHMAFVSQSRGAYFWDRAAAWLLQTSPVGRAGSLGTQSDAPPSGTKESAAAGSAAPS